MKSANSPPTARKCCVNISNDGWYGDSGAYAQHLKQARMRAVENDRWLLRDTNTGVTAAIDPYGRIVASAPRKIRTALQRALRALTDVTTFYTRHGDWFAYLCAIISVVALVMRLPFRRKTSRRDVACNVSCSTLRRMRDKSWSKSSNRNTQS